MAGLRRVLEPTKRAAPVKQTMGDIECANACDADAKTRHVVKVIKSSACETTVEGFHRPLRQPARDVTRWTTCSAFTSSGTTTNFVGASPDAELGATSESR